MIEMDSKNLLYEGKAKSVFQGENPDEVIIDFRDDMTAGDGARKEEMDKLAAIATPIRLNRFGEAACPKCNRDLDHKGKTEPQKCSKCGLVYKIIR